ncbi:MAG: EAL domain-containing protein [Pelovirga sp.]
MLNKHKDGHLFWEHAQICPLRDTAGGITHYIGIKKDISVQKKYEQQLERQATHDPLTGLANRILLKDRLEQAISHALRSGLAVAVLLLDLDRFKIVNDSLGHAFGDDLLCQVAQRLRGIVRECDTIARFGGDEFVVVLTEVASPDVVAKVAAKILSTLNQPFHLSSRDVTLTASLGISLAPTDSCDGATLIRYADIAMYQSKRRRSEYSFFTEEMNRHLLTTLELESALRQALENKEFRLFYQPKVDLKTGRIDSCEALLRWQHPQRGMVSPGQFIPLAEETGLIVPIGIWVLEEACRQNLSWQQRGMAPIQTAVNISARQFRQGDVVEIVSRTLERSGLDPALLDLELTESMVMDNPHAAHDTLHELKRLGVDLSLDDFGTGYSSLNYLRRFPVDNLKIDQTFISDVADDESAASVTTSIIAIAHSLKMRAIAEGVETPEQLDFLMSRECDAMQGYLFSRPLPAETFAELLKEGKTLQPVLLNKATPLRSSRAF